MKFTLPWRAGFFFVCGLAIGIFITQNAIMKRLPPTQEINISKIKLKGKGNSAPTLDLTIEDITQETPKTRKEIRQERRSARRLD